MFINSVMQTTETHVDFNINRFTYRSFSASRHPLKHEQYNYENTHKHNTHTHTHTHTHTVQMFNAVARRFYARPGRMLCRVKGENKPFEAIEPQEGRQQRHATLAAHSQWKARSHVSRSYSERVHKRQPTTHIFLFIPMCTNGRSPE